MSPPIEVTTRYATTVDDLPAAWAFVMDKLDSVGPDPSVEIKPLWAWAVQDMDRSDDYVPPRQFSVVVSGMVEEGDR
jgi:hypothetical protein